LTFFDFRLSTALGKELMEAEITVPDPTPVVKAVVTKGWKLKRVGNATFAISKPKRNPRKLRQARLKSKRRAR